MSAKVSRFADDALGIAAAEDVAHVHEQDVGAQDRYGVRFLTYWYYQDRESGFCLIDTPDRETATRVHKETHGNEALDIIEVDLSAVDAFLGRVSDPPMVSPRAKPEIDSAFRVVMFTDIVGSTSMTSRLGDVRSVEMVRAHDLMIRRALGDSGGQDIKHTGDGIMASFGSVTGAASSTRAIQEAFEEFNRSSSEKLEVRIGMHCGEPVQDSNDLFGSTVQMAARICARASPNQILVSDALRLELPHRFSVIPVGSHTLKGFLEPVPLYEVAWRRS